MLHHHVLVESVDYVSKSFMNNCPYFFQCDIMRHNEIDVALNHRVLKLETSETLSTV